MYKGYGQYSVHFKSKGGILIAIQRTNQKLCQILLNTRIAQDKSQRYMARQLNRSPGTIASWEDGSSSPTILEVIEWFEVLNLNPVHYLYQILEPTDCTEPDVDDDEFITQKLLEYITNIATAEIRRKLYFNILGNTTSDFRAQLDLLTAHNLCPIDVKISNAWAVYHHYVMAKKRNESIASPISPNMDYLQKAIQEVERIVFSKNI